MTSEENREQLSPETAAALNRGIHQSAAGQTKSLGDFSRYSGPVREEMDHFANGTGPYKSSDLNECAALFLERNHVVRIPEEGLLEVTRDGNMIKVNGENYLSKADQFDMQALVKNCESAIDSIGNSLRRAVLEHEKAKAVQAFLAQEQEAAKRREMDREKRLEELAREYYGVPFRAVTGPMGVRMLERLADLEQRLAAAS